MSNLVIDVSGYQDSSLSYFKKFKGYGVKSALVKLTEGTSYTNPKAGAQITNALKVFGTVGAYHFFHGYGTAEAKYFVSKAKAFGLDKTTVMIIDVEATDLPYYSTSQVNVFLRYLKRAGYTNVVTYGSRSWFQAGRISYANLADKHIWVAAYGTSQPGINGANAWQFTDNFHGVDCSYDFDGTLTGKATSTKTATQKPEYYVTPGLYEVSIDMIHQYNDIAGKSKRYARLTKGSRFYATPVKYGKITRLKTKTGYYTSRKGYVKFIKKAG